MSGLTEALGSMQSALLWICAIAALLVFAAMVYSTVTFRPEANKPRVSKVAREFAWTLVPILIVVAAAAPSMRNAVSLPTRSLLTDNLDSRRCTAAQMSVAHSDSNLLSGACSKNP